MLCSFCEILRIYYPLLLRGRVEDAEEKLVIQAVAKTGLFCNKTRCCWFYSTSSGWPHVRKTHTVVQYLYLYMRFLFYNILLWDIKLQIHLRNTSKIVEFFMIVILKNLAYLEQMYISIQSLEGCCILVFFQ